MAGRNLPAAEALCREYHMLPSGGHVLCAVSGGADSVCLLHWLNGLRTQYGFTLTVAHYNHNLRGDESRRDADFVRSFVETCCPGVELILGSGDVAKQATQTKAGIEETAREMRYAFLQEAALRVGADTIATAHNAEDNAETVLLHLIRGSGLRGLTGIPPRRGNTVRPLLTTRRADIEAYLRIYGLPHVEDSSNTDQRYARNRVRHQLLPLLETMQPRFVDHMTQTAHLLSLDEDCLVSRSRELLPLPQAIPAGLSAHAPSIANQPDALAVRMVQQLLDSLNGDGGKCTQAHLQAILSLCRGTDPSAQISLPGGVLARRVYDRLELVREDGPQTFDPARLSLPGDTVLPSWTFTVRQTTYASDSQTPYSFYLSCDKVGSELTLRSRRIGDMLARPARPRRPLKKILIDEKIPRFMRDTIPVLDCGGRVAAVAGLGPDSDFFPVPGETCWHIICTSHIKKGSF